MLPWLRDFGASHVHAHFGTNSAEVAMLVHALGGPTYSFTVHGPEEFDKPQFFGLAEKVRGAAFVVAISSFCSSQLFRWVEHSHWPRIHVVHCGLEPSFYEGVAAAPSMSRRLVSVGRLNEQKGQQLLIEAAHRLASDGIEFELVLAGDGEMRPQIETMIREYGLVNRVKITGWISGDEVRREILAARGLVLSSFAEGLPVVLMEAMSLRRPVLATYVAGIPELVRPGENGWLVPAGSMEDLARAMAELLSCSESELARLGDAARRRALERHSIEVESAKLAALFRRYRVVS